MMDKKTEIGSDVVAAVVMNNIARTHGNGIQSQYPARLFWFTKLKAKCELHNKTLSET